MMVLFPMVGHAATDASDTTSDAKSKALTPFERAIEAGKRVSSQALSSKPKETDETPAQSEASQKELTPFQKKMAAIAQGEMSGTTENSLSDFTTTAAPAEKISATAKKTSAVKKATAAKAKEEKEEVVDPNAPKPVIKRTSGTVTGINNQGIAIEYAEDKDKGGMEFWINFDKKVQKAGGLRELSGLGIGDTVNAVYDEYPNKAKKLTEITLLKKKPKEKGAA